MTYDFEFFLKRRNIIILWIFVGIITAILQYTSQGIYSRINNFIIFKTSFFHLLEHRNLYLEYPKEYFDLYLYGPVFAVLIAPFSYLPTWLSYTIWNTLNAVFLLYAIYQLPLSEKNKALITWISFVCLITSLQNSQIHAMTVAFIILSYTLINKKQYFWASFFLVLGVSIKLYGIVGLAFFFFVEDKPKYILYCVFWSVFLFLLPMTIGGVDYIVNCYADWYHALVHKNQINISLDNHRTDICVMGMFRRIFRDRSLSNLYFIIPGMVIFALCYLRISLFKNKVFQLRIVASALLFIILASTGSESPTIIIGFVGVAIWYIVSKRTTTDKIILLFVLIFSSFSPTDFFPSYIRDHFINKYALMVFPLLLVWVKLNWEIVLSEPVEFLKTNNRVLKEAI